MKAFLAVLLVFLLIQYLFVAPAVAQSNQTNCKSGSSFAWIGFFSPPPGLNCAPWGPFVFLLVCSGNTSNCAPAVSPNETDCPDCAGHPIRLANGRTFIAQTDINIPGLSNGLSLVRTWNSIWPASQSGSSVGLFGPNWRSTYEERIFLDSIDGYVRYARGNGSYWSFGFGGPQYAVAAPMNAGATLTYGPSWTLTLKNGEQRLFDANSGSLTKIIDRNGNTTILAYDFLNRLVTVTDPASRHLNFTYASDTSFLVTGVSSDVGGMSLTYAYDAQNRLIQVTKPDQTTLNFQYDGNSMITAVTDTNGKVLESHTYDSSHRGLTSSRANGVESLTITYQ